jgi:hypothetical protein
MMNCKGFGSKQSSTNFKALSWKEHRLKVSENRVLKRMFAPKRDEITGEWRKLNHEGIIFLLSDRLPSFSLWS